MKHLTIITQYFYPNASATSQLMTDLVRGFSQRGYHVKVITGCANRQTEPTAIPDLAATTIQRLVSPIPSRNSLFSKIVASIHFCIGVGFNLLFFQSRQERILLASNPPYIGLLGVCFRWLRRGKYYFLLQDLFPESAVHIGILPAKGQLVHSLDWLTYLTCKYAQKVIVLSETMQTVLSQKYPDLQSKFCLIENWSVVESFTGEQQHNPFVMPHDLDRQFTVHYSGNMGRLHDIESLAIAAQLLRDQPIRWIFIGEGAKLPLLEHYQQQHQLDKMLILPLQSQEVLAHSLAACDVSIVSLVSGADRIIAPCKLYGILAAGRAVVAISDPGSYLDRLLTTYACGVNCPPHRPDELASVLQQLAAQPDKLQLMGDNARWLYQEYYNFERAIAQYEALLFS